MSIVSRGFQGRRRQPGAGLIPPGQYIVDDFPVLSAGPTPFTPLEEWDFTIVDETGSVAARWTWDEFRDLPAETPTVDIHCVTKWSKLGTRWEGVSVDTLLDGIDTSAEFVIAFADGGYTTNLPLADVQQRTGVGGVRLRGRGAGARAWRAGPAVGAPPVLLEERQVGSWTAAERRRRAGLLGERRLPQLRRPVA